MGENTRYIHIRHPKTFPRQSYRIQNPSPFPAPFSLLVSRFVIAVPLIVLPCRCGGKIAFMFKQPIVLTIMRLIVSPLSCRLACRASRRCPVPSSHLFISSCVRSFRPHACRPAVSPFRLSSSPTLVPFLSPPYRQAGRGVMSPAVSPYCRRMSVISSCEMSLDVVRCKGRGYHRISQNVMFGKQ